VSSNQAICSSTMVSNHSTLMFMRHILGTGESYKSSCSILANAQHLQAKHYCTFSEFLLIVSIPSLCFYLKKAPALLRSPSRPCTMLQQLPRSRSLLNTLLHVRSQRYTWHSATRMPQALRQATTSTQTKLPKKGSGNGAEEIRSVKCGRVNLRCRKGLPDHAGGGKSQISAEEFGSREVR